MTREEVLHLEITGKHLKNGTEVKRLTIDELLKQTDKLLDWYTKKVVTFHDLLAKRLAQDLKLKQLPEDATKKDKEKIQERIDKYKTKLKKEKGIAWNHQQSLLELELDYLDLLHAEIEEEGFIELLTRIMHYGTKEQIETAEAWIKQNEFTLEATTADNDFNESEAPPAEPLES